MNECSDNSNNNENDESNNKKKKNSNDIINHNINHNHHNTVLNGCVTAWLVFVNLLYVYFIGTFLNRAECFACQVPTTHTPPLVWFTSWTLWWTSVAQIGDGSGSGLGGIGSLVANVRSTTMTKTSSSSTRTTTNGSNRRWPRWRVVAFQIALPLSMAVSIGYTLYLLDHDGGRDLVDSELCFSVMDIGIPRTVHDHAWVNMFLTGGIMGSFTAHYVCVLWNIYVYFADYHTCLNRNSSSCVNKEGEEKDENLEDYPNNNIVDRECESNAAAVVAHDPSVSNNNSNNNNSDKFSNKNVQQQVQHPLRAEFIPVLLWIVVQSIVIALSQEYIDSIYCTQGDNGSIISLVASVTCAVVLFHAALFHSKLHQFCVRHLVCGRS